MFLLLALLLLIFLPSPWNLAAALASALLGAVEVLFWERRMRTHKVRTGVEDLLGATGEVTAPLAPLGQIIVRGEIWEAHSPTPIDRGARVRVVGVEELRLEVRPVEDGSQGMRAAGSAALLAILVLALSGCGGDDGASASEDYADGVCSSLSNWATEVESTVKTLADAGLSINEDDVKTALDDIKDANKTLSDDLEGLGAPETDDGNKAKSELDSLTTVISEQADKVEQALDSGGRATAVAGAVTTAVATAANAVDMTYQNLRQLDPAGELQDAFENSDECKSLEDQLSRNGS
jgi:membrane protein implicated in regulation of membrane protease activity